MTKRRPAFDNGQLAFTFEPQPRADSDGALRGLDRAVASAVSQILKDDPGSRFDVASGMSRLLDDEVSKLMLDAYSAEARDTHNISFSRFLALVAETGRFDILAALVARIGASLVVGEEIHTLRLGHIGAQIQALKAEEARLKRVATPVTRKSPLGGRSK